MQIKDEISLRQLLIIYVLLVGSPAIRLIPVYVSKAARQAGWLAPTVSLGILLVLFLIFQQFFNKFKKESFLDIVQKIFGKYLGTALNIAYLILITILGALYVRYYSERMVTSLFPNTNSFLFSVIFLTIIAVVLRSGLAIFARMNEIFLPIVVLTYLVVNILIFPEVEIDNLYPITYKDIFPVLKASVGTTAILGYVTFLFILSDKVKGKDKVKSFGFHSSYLLAILLSLVVISPVGVFFFVVVAKMNLPFFAAVKDISLFGIIERVESSLIAIWTLTDFSIITSFLFVGIHIINWLFKAPSEKPFINMYVVIIYILSMYIAGNIIELINLSNVLVFAIIGFTIIMPIILFIVGKIRKLV